MSFLLPASISQLIESMDESKIVKLADNAYYVFSVYALTIAPLALYVYHDVLDTRWRPVWRLVKFLIAYFILYVLSGIGLVIYIVVQAIAGDHKEVGASALALILGSYGAWKLTRLARIISAHRTLVRVLQRIDESLCKLTGLNPVGLKYHLFNKPRNAATGNEVAKITWKFETRHDFISSSLFDDDYPGEAAARIKWLPIFSKKVQVKQEDADECASRVALWMRLVLRRPRSEPWKLLTSTSPLVQGHLYRTSLGEALRDLITYGSAGRPPLHADRNPAEELLNGGNLTTVGVGFFWTASQMGQEEMSEVLSEMPPRWMRGVTQNGKQLMYEIVISLVLCEMPDPQDKGLQWILSLPVLHWKRDVSNLRVWQVISEICADAVVSFMPKYSHAGKSPASATVADVVQRGIMSLHEVTSVDHVFQGDVVGLSLIELIRCSYRAGYLAEKILGQPIELEVMRNDWNGMNPRLYKGEIVTGLCAILTKLGQDEVPSVHAELQEAKKSWGVSPGVTNILEAIRERVMKEKEESFSLDVVAMSRAWFLGDRKTQCEDPPSAFATISTTAIELAPFVYRMLEGYLQNESKICPISASGDPERFREQWITWKMTQAHELSSSTEAFQHPGASRTQVSLGLP